MRPHDMKYIGFKHQRENKQNSDKKRILSFHQMPLVHHDIAEKCSFSI
jgi:hypothetical protein